MNEVKLFEIPIYSMKEEVYDKEIIKEGKILYKSIVPSFKLLKLLFEFHLLKSL